MAETYTCEKCTMGFRVEEKATIVSENHKCPDCYRVFWSAMPNRNLKQQSRAIVGISPKDIDETGLWV